MRASSCLRNEAGGLGSAGMTLSSWPDSRVSGWHLDRGLLGACLGGSQMEIWPGPREAQAQGLLTVSCPPSTEPSANPAIGLGTVDRVVSWGS